jgi:hypothetical protein
MLKNERVLMAVNIEKGNDEPKKGMSIGGSISFSASAVVIRIRKEAREELERIPDTMRRDVLNEAVDISKVTTHPFDITSDEIKEAKKRKGVPVD